MLAGGRVQRGGLRLVVPPRVREALGGGDDVGARGHGRLELWPDDRQGGVRRVEDDGRRGLGQDAVVVGDGHPQRVPLDDGPEVAADLLGVDVDGADELDAAVQGGPDDAGADGSDPVLDGRDAVGTHADRPPSTAPSAIRSATTVSAASRRASTWSAVVW